MKNPVVSQTELQALAQKFLVNLKQRNNPFLIQMLPADRIFVTDLDAAFRFSCNGLEAISTERARCDVALGSEALSYAFRFMWGGDTLNINGRFVKERGRFWHFRVWFAVAARNNMDQMFSFAYVFLNFGIVARKFVSNIVDRRTQRI